MTLNNSIYTLSRHAFSCVIPLYNKRGYVDRAVRSILEQSISELELIIVDDGSTDGSIESLYHFHDERIRVIRQSNAGECAARNTGIQAASYENIAFLDADDEWLPHFLSTISALMSKFPDCGVYATAYYKNIEGIGLQVPIFNIPMASPQGTILEDYFEASLKNPPVCSSAVVLSKNAIKACGGFPVGIRSGGDLYTWARLALAHKFAWSPLHCAIYHIEAGTYHMAGSETRNEISITDVLMSPEACACSLNQLSSLRKYINRYRLSTAARLVTQSVRIPARILLAQAYKDGENSIRLVMLYVATILPSFIYLPLRSFLNVFRRKLNK